MIKKRILLLMPVVVAVVCCLLSVGQVQADPCTATPPGSGTWEITTDCTCGGSGQDKTITLNDTVNVLVKSGAVLTIKGDFDFKMDLENANLTVENGSGVLIENGGKLQQK